VSLSHERGTEAAQGRGAGRGADPQAAHFEACRKSKNAELYAICEVAEDLLERMSEIHAPI